jgi:hypothetical protein
MSAQANKQSAEQKDNDQGDRQNANLNAAYQELCKSYHAIDDFRTKLLGLLPLATAGGIVVLLKDRNDLESLDVGTKGLLAAVGAFGGLITLGLFAYELYGIKKCGALILAGKLMERSLLKNTGKIRVCRIRSPACAGCVAAARISRAISNPRCNVSRTHCICALATLTYCGGLIFTRARGTGVA